MKAVFDTNILIDYLNGDRRAGRELERYAERLISIITYIEVMVGAKDAAEAALIRSFLGTFKIREVSVDVAERAVELRQQHRLRVPDAIVYATARCEGCLIVSRNTKDLDPKWPDVRVPYRG